MIVADASIMLAFIMHDESEPYADAAVVALAREGGNVPGNFHSEIAHALLQAERRGRIDQMCGMAVLREILELPLSVEMPDPQHALQLARKHRLTGYDGFYLALAIDLDQPLATVDATLAAVARAAGVFWKHPT